MSNFLLLVVFVLATGSGASFAQQSQQKDNSSGIIAFSDSERVVMGGRAVIDKLDSIEKLVIIGGTAEVYGTVRDLVVVGGYLHLKEGAVVLKDLVVVGGFVDRETGSEILGKQVDITLPVSEEGWRELSQNLKEEYFDDVLEENQWIAYLTAALKVFALLALCLLGRVLTPGLMNRTSQYLRQSFWWSGCLGITTTLLILPVTMFLILSLVGIPLLPLQFSLLILFVLYGEIHVAGFLGSMLTRSGARFSFVSTAIGLVLLQSLSFVPYLGVLKWLLVLAGFGATAKVFNQRLFAKLND